MMRNQGITSAEDVLCVFDMPYLISCTHGAQQRPFAQSQVTFAIIRPRGTPKTALVVREPALRFQLKRRAGASAGAAFCLAAGEAPAAV